MSLCEMCGKESSLITAKVESVEMQLCSVCVKFGVVKRKSAVSYNNRPFRPKQVMNTQPEFTVVSNFSSIIRSLREKSGMSQEDFAKKLNERESVVAKWESGNLNPRLDVARRLGRILKVNLVKKVDDKDDSVDIEKKSSDEFTLGDFIKVKKRH